MTRLECVVCLGGEHQAACRKRYRLVLAEQDCLRIGRRKIGARCLGIARTVQMLSSQHRIIDKDHGRSTVQLPLPCVGERSVDAVAYQRMSEL